MTSGVVISCRNLLSCLFAFLLTTCAARRKAQKDDVPPPEYDENGCKCAWSPWMNNDDFDVQVGDDTTYENLRHLYDFCQTPKDIRCRDKYMWSVPYFLLHLKNTVCSAEIGLKCVSKPHSKIKPHYCSDFEITVECCICPTTTVPPETTVAVTTTTMGPPESLMGSSNNEELLDFVDLHFDIRQPNGTAKGDKKTSEEGIPLTVILIIVFGCIIIIGFIVVIYLILSKTTLHKRRVPARSYYQEAPNDDFTKRGQPREAVVPRVAFSPPSGSSDYLTTSSDDEGYRSRPSYNRKRRTKGQRDRKLHNGNKHGGHASDSLEFPTLDSRSPAEENSDDGRFRKWFPDEYERALEQKQRQQPPSKTRLLFSAPISAMNRKSIPYAEDDV